MKHLYQLTTKKLLEYYLPNYDIITFSKASTLCPRIAKNDLNKMQRRNKTILKCEVLKVS